MEYIPTNPILEFNKNQMMSVRKQHNLDKPGEINQAIDVLEAWVKMQKHFLKKELPRNYLEKAIITSKGSLERAKKKVDKICTFRTVMPDFFGDNLLKNNFENIFVFRSILLPKPTSDNYRVYMLKVIGSTFSHDLLMDCYRFIVMLCEYFMAYDYSNGITVVIDYTEADLFELIKYLTMTELHQIFTVVTEAFGLRLKGINILTPSKAVQAVVALLKSLLSPKLGSRIHVHKDISTLYQCVPKDILPREYGGKERPFAELHDKIKEEFSGKAFTNYMEEMNNAKTDESCRQTDTINEHYLNMSGSFRTLNVD